MKALKLLFAVALIACFAVPAEAGLFRHRHKSVLKVVTVNRTHRCGGGVCR